MARTEDDELGLLLAKCEKGPEKLMLEKENVTPTLLTDR